MADPLDLLLIHLIFLGLKEGRGWLKSVRQDLPDFPHGLPPGMPLSVCYQELPMGTQHPKGTAGAAVTPNSLSLRQAWSRGCATSSSRPFSQMRSSVKCLLMAAVVVVFSWEGKWASAEDRWPPSIPSCQGGPFLPVHLGRDKHVECQEGHRSPPSGIRKVSKPFSGWPHWPGLHCAHMRSVSPTTEPWVPGLS